MAQKGEQTHRGEDHCTDGWRHCLHAIHWLRTAADHPHLLRAPLSGTEEKPRDVQQPVQGQSPGAEGPERDPHSTSLPPRAEGPDRGRVMHLRRLSVVDTLREGATPRCRGP